MSSLLAKVARAKVMQEPFPTLTLLRLSSEDGTRRSVPAHFWVDPMFTGNIPRRRSIPSITDTPFIDQRPCQSPNSQYTAMVAGLALLTRLETLSIRFQSQIFALNNGGGFASPSASCPSLSPFLSSKEMANIWRTSWPKSTLLDSSSLASSPTVPVHRSRRKARASPVQACASRTSWWQRLHQLCL